VVASVQELLQLLELEDIDTDVLLGKAPSTSLQRVFGGQVLAQALAAAARTVVERAPHSLHGYFLRPGDPDRPIVYLVERVRDGRSFTTRRVVARQHGLPIFHMTASFQIAERGLEHQAPMPGAPAPTGLPTLRDRLVDQGRRAAADVRDILRLPLDAHKCEALDQTRLTRATTAHKWIQNHAATRRDQSHEVAH